MEVRLKPGPLQTIFVLPPDDLCPAPPDEVIRHSFSCALERSFLYHGRMFLSGAHLCFHSNVFSKELTVCIPYQDIEEVRRSTHALINPAMTVVLHLGTGGHGVPPLPSPDGRVKYKFASFWNRGHAMRLLQEVIAEFWKMEEAAALVRIYLLVTRPCLSFYLLPSLLLLCIDAKACWRRRLPSSGRPRRQRHWYVSLCPYWSLLSPLALLPLATGSPAWLSHRGMSCCSLQEAIAKFRKAEEVVVALMHLLVLATGSPATCYWLSCHSLLALLPLATGSPATRYWLSCHSLLALLPLATGSPATRATSSPAASRHEMLQEAIAEFWKTEVLTALFEVPCTAKTYFNLLYSDSSDFVVVYRAKRKDTELKVGEWKETEQYGGKMREVTYRSLCDSPMCPPSTAMTEWQHTAFSAPDHKHLVLELINQAHDVPFGSYFEVHAQWTVKTTSDNPESPSCTAELKAGVHMKKRCVMQGKIRQGAQAEMKRNSQAMMEMAMTYIAEQAQSGNQPADVRTL
ncbi:unnamed protein product [Closterium sp. NIES-54]